MAMYLSLSETVPVYTHYPDTLDIIKVRAVHQKTFKRVKRQAIEWEIFVIQIYLIKDSYPKYIF